VLEENLAVLPYHICKDGMVDLVKILDDLRSAHQKYIGIG
jgi:hypothetical protein